MRRKIRIGQILTNLHDGGIEKVVLQLATGLDPERFETRVYALINDNPWIEVFRSNGIPVTVIGADNRPGLPGIGTNLRALVRLASALRQDRIDIASTHDFFPAVLGRMASLLAGVPHRVTTLHNTYTWFRWPHHAINRLLANWTDSVIAVSSAALEYSQIHDRLGDEIYRLIPNGIPLPAALPASTRQEVLEELGIPSSAFVIGNVGTHSVRKGQRFLLEAASELIEEHPDLHVVIIGSARPHELDISKHLHALANAPKLAGHVHFLENRHDMHRLYRSFDAFCMPSIAEGLSLASLEAMASGCPCIFSDIGPFREIATDGEDALFFPVGASSNLAGRIETLHRDPCLREALKASASQRIQRKGGMAAMLHKYENLLHSISKASNV